MSSFDPVAREFSPVGIYPIPRPSITQPTTISAPPPTDTPQSPKTTPSPSLPTDVAALHSIINTLQAELKATTSLNTNLAASVARLQAELTNIIINVNNQFAASVARLQAEQTIPTSTSTTTPTPAATDHVTTLPTTAPLLCFHPGQTIPTSTSTTTPNPAPTDHATTSPTTAPLPCSHPEHPRTIASGRGAASPEVFQEMIKTNWHGRLGRTHMVDVDALSSTALTELDCLVRRKLHAIYPRGAHGKKPLDLLDATFAGLAALGLRLEDRGAYADLPVIHDPNVACRLSTIKRGRDSVAYYLTNEEYEDYWQGSMMETLVELARYRGLFDSEGYLKEE